MKIAYLLWLFAFIALTSCNIKKDIDHNKDLKDPIKIGEYNGHYKISDKDSKPSVEIGTASWYGQHNHKDKKTKKIKYNTRTANSDIFDCRMLTAAHKTLPLPSIARITNLSNNKAIIVMVNDRGPYAKGRILDVSSKVAEYLEFKKQGIAKVKIEPMPKESKDLLGYLALKPLHGSKASGKIAKKGSADLFVQNLNSKEGRKDIN
ncbi:MAG: septal ring lytic transglycosylase RlpA family protein [Rickettsiaceae bacterium]|nr:septal ring lytic transglycosylase RlpA family protein [Rickettsiaceae bacterium]